MQVSPGRDSLISARISEITSAFGFAPCEALLERLRSLFSLLRQSGKDRGPRRSRSGGLHVCNGWFSGVGHDLQSEKSGEDALLLRGVVLVHERLNGRPRAFNVAFEIANHRMSRGVRFPPAKERDGVVFGQLEFFEPDPTKNHKVRVGSEVMDRFLVFWILGIRQRR